MLLPCSTIVLPVISAFTVWAGAVAGFVVGGVPVRVIVSVVYFNVTEPFVWMYVPVATTDSTFPSARVVPSVPSGLNSYVIEIVPTFVDVDSVHLPTIGSAGLWQRKQIAQTA